MFGLSVWVWVRDGLDLDACFGVWLFISWFVVSYLLLASNV